ncbi:hypothetical protein IQ255_31215 [Pleurocapsales cyanobacterium LEGE 10410]|nr:hypothetical protein [Pleurocapsales cyanobacterium LEGE 10410]
MARKKSKRAQIDPATKNFSQGVSVLHRHPMFAPLLTYALRGRQPSHKVDWMREAAFIPLR